MDNINDIISGLSSSDMDMLKSVASSILGGEGQTQSKEVIPEPEHEHEQKQSSTALSALGDLNLGSSDFQMIMKAKSMFEKMNTGKNKNVDLIEALRPHLSSKTQDKADQAIQIIRLFEMLPLMKDLF